MPVIDIAARGAVPDSTSAAVANSTLLNGIFAEALATPGPVVISTPPGKFYLDGPVGIGPIGNTKADILVLGAGRRMSTWVQRDDEAPVLRALGTASNLRDFHLDGMCFWGGTYGFETSWWSYSYAEDCTFYQNSIGGLKFNGAMGTLSEVRDCWFVHTGDIVTEGVTAGALRMSGNIFGEDCGVINCGAGTFTIDGNRFHANSGKIERDNNAVIRLGNAWAEVRNNDFGECEIPLVFYDNARALAFVNNTARMVDGGLIFAVRRFLDASGPSIQYVNNKITVPAGRSATVAQSLIGHQIKNIQGSNNTHILGDGATLTDWDAVLLPTGNNVISGNLLVPGGATV